MCVDESTNAEHTPYLFTGKELDEETSLYYHGARYYDPPTSQFISPDPLLSRDPHKTISQASALSLYAYADNYPLRNNDPPGRSITMAKDINEAARNLARWHAARRQPRQVPQDGPRRPWWQLSDQTRYDPR